jgi:hypothetical protein
MLSPVQASVESFGILVLGRKSDALTFLSLEPLDAYRLTRRRTISTDDVKYLVIRGDRTMIAAVTWQRQWGVGCGVPCSSAALIRRRRCRNGR